MKLKKNKILRHLIQLFIFLFLLIISFSHIKYGIEKTASIDAYCPYGAVESFLTTLFTGKYLTRIWTSSFILLFITVVLTFFLGRVFCGYLCPLGALQEWLRVLGKKLGFKKDIELPLIIDKYARFIKYFILLAIPIISYRLGDLFFRNYDPYNALMHLGNEVEEKFFAYAILLVILIVSLFSQNLWCRYFCPLGAFLGLIKKISPFKLKRDQNTCISCGLCDRVCPAGLDVSRAETVKSADCISCGNCVSDCPKDSLSFEIAGKKISLFYLTLAVIVLFFLPLIIIKTTPLWQTKAPTNISSESGKINPENIRGSNTLKTIINETKIPLEVFIEKLNLPSDIDTSLMLKEIGPKYNLKNAENNLLETEDFRDVIRNYKSN